MRFEFDNNTLKCYTGKRVYPYTIGLGTDPTNCKLSYIHGAGNLAALTREDVLKVINEALKRLKGAIILNTTSGFISNIVKENYEVYYASNVPIGYNGSYQYHICFRNKIHVNHNCRIPKAPEVYTGDKRDAVKTKLLKILKDKRRKADYVDEFINSL